MNTLDKTSTDLAAAAVTARDLFAAHALAAIVGGPKLAGVPRADAAGMAKQAFEYADAMMAARSR